jgi:hypothetical protein
MSHEILFCNIGSGQGIQNETIFPHCFLGAL